MLPRKTAMPRPSKPIPQMSAKRRAEFEANGWPVNSTFPPSRTALRDRKRPADTGPKRSTVEMLKDRSGGICEWPGCNQPATDKHHRLNRKAGGRHGAMRTLINGVAWLLHACRTHHDRVTNPTGEVRERAERMGWILREHQYAVRVPVLTRHDPEPVWLDDAGHWHRYEDGTA